MGIRGSVAGLTMDEREAPLSPAQMKWRSRNTRARRVCVTCGATFSPKERDEYALHLESHIHRAVGADGCGVQVGLFS